MDKFLTFALVKPAGPDCNLTCTYCFYKNKNELYPKSSIHRMSIPLLEKVIARMVQDSNGPEVTFGWQGGEPTLMGLSFFEKAIEFQKKYCAGKVINNTFQTNGIKIDKQWAEFFKKNNFLVGISLDGPEHIHDHYRLKFNGKGSWKQVVESTKMLLHYGVETNVLSVVNDYSVNYPEEIYKYFKELGIVYMQFIPCVEKLRDAPQKVSPESISPEKYGEFLCSQFDLWSGDFKDRGPTTSIKYFDSVMYYYLNLVPPQCDILPECGVYIIIEHNGDVYSCDFFVEPEWKLGNITEMTPQEMFYSERQDHFGKMKLDLAEICKSCECKELCRGGCLKNRVIDNRDYLCDAIKIFHKYSKEKFIQLAQDYAEKHSLF